MVRRITHQNCLLSIIIPKDFSNQGGVHFVTPVEFSQQLGFLKHPSGTKIEPHLHQVDRREVNDAQEILFIKKGKVRVDLYSKKQKYIESVLLEAGDTIMLVAGGHGIEILEDTEIIEVKQGPYIPSKDKLTFKGISPYEVVMRDIL